MSSPELAELKTQITLAHDHTNALFHLWHGSELGKTIAEIDRLLEEYGDTSESTLSRAEVAHITGAIKEVRKTAIKAYLDRHPDKKYKDITHKPKNPYAPKLIKRPFFWLRRTKGVAYSVQSFHSRVNRCSPNVSDGRPLRSEAEDNWVHAETAYINLKRRAAEAFPRAPRAPRTVLPPRPRREPKHIPTNPDFIPKLPGGFAPPGGPDIPEYPVEPGHHRAPGAKAKFSAPYSRAIPPFPAYR